MQLGCTRHRARAVHVNDSSPADLYPPSARLPTDVLARAHRAAAGSRWTFFLPRAAARRVRARVAIPAPPLPRARAFAAARRARGFSGGDAATPLPLPKVDFAAATISRCGAAPIWRARLPLRCAARCFACALLPRALAQLEARRNPRFGMPGPSIRLSNEKAAGKASATGAGGALAASAAASAAGAPPVPMDMLPCRLTRTRGRGGGEGDAATVDATDAAGECGGERLGERAA